MEKIKVKRKISCLMVSILILTTALGNGLTSFAIADESDTYNWTFQTAQGMPITEPIAGEYSNVKGQGTPYTVRDEYDLKILDASTRGTNAESYMNLVDQNQGTKYCQTTTIPSAFVFDAGSSVVPTHYYIQGANDDASYSSRRLYSWRLEGSNSNSELTGGTWTTVDTVANSQWPSSNYYLKVVEIPNPQAFRYYRLVVTGAGTTGTTGSTMIQFSCFGLLNGPPQTVGSTDVTDYLYPQIAGGPSAIWDSSTAPWNGANVLSVNGTVVNAGYAKSYTTIKKDLNIKIHNDTKFSYMITPEGASASAGTFAGYDYKYTSHHMSLDLKFSDGTRLKDLGAKDQYGYGLNPKDQGESKVLGTCMWNYVWCDLGKVAAGKTITEIIVGFEMDDASANAKAKSCFDDIKIYRDDVKPQSIELADLVDIRQGTNVGSLAMGALMPMAAMPNPFNMWAPSTNASGASKYDYNNGGLKGISISHVASRHMGERGAFQFMTNSTVTSVATADTTTAVNNRNGKFNHENEIAHNYHYAVKFNDDDSQTPGVTMEITPTVHAAVMRFTFLAGSAARNILLTPTDSSASVLTSYGTDSNIFTAYTDSSDTRGMRRMYIYGEFSAVPTNFIRPSSNNALSLARFADLANGTEGSTVIELKIATSFISAAQAKVNLDLEIASNDNFDTVRGKAKSEWNKILGAISIADEDANYSQLSNFYSKLARTHLYPTLLAENQGTNETPVWRYASPYRGSASAPTVMNGYFIYNEGWWDTYRSAWALSDFLRPAASTNLLNGVVNHFLDNDGNSSTSNFGGIPRWVSPGGNQMMVGTSSDVIIADAYMRGIDFDYQNGYLSALKSSSVGISTGSSNGGRNGTQTSTFLGYTAWGTGGGEGGGSDLSTSFGLEGFLNDGGIAKMALKMRGEKAPNSYDWKKLNDEYNYFLNRSKFYINYYNPANGGWLRNRNADGTWHESDAAFNPHAWGNGYCEDNAFPYSVLATQDGNGLANIYGGKKAFGDKLQDIFTNNGDYVGGGYGGVIHEGTEKREVKLGQVAMSNQTAYHLPYMWLFSDRPWETQKYVREIINRVFSGEAIGRGYIGEEDNGAFASWYTLSALGLYSLDVGSGQFVIGSPSFKKVTVTTDKGDKYYINAPNNSHDNVYIAALKIDGVDYNKTYIEPSQFHDGMTMDFVMSPVPTAWGTDANSAPPSPTKGDATPDIMMDLTKAATPGTSMPSSASVVDGAYTPGATNGANLFNNTSANEATWTGRTAEIYYYFPKEVMVDMYTLTSSVATANTYPTEWTLYGSNDGDAAAPTWVQLDSRSGETFAPTGQWYKYTRPFTAANKGKYKYYRLSIANTASANLRLSQIELLGDAYAFSDKPDLLAKLNEAGSIDRSLYGPDEYQTLSGLITEGFAVYNDDASTGKQIKETIDKIDNAIKSLILIRPAQGNSRPDGVTVDVVPMGDAYQIWSSRLGTETTSNATGTVTGSIRNVHETVPGEYIGFKYIDFGNGDHWWNKVGVNYANNQVDCVGGYILVHLDSLTGPTVARIDLSPVTSSTNGWNIYAYATGTIADPTIKGLHTVYFEFGSPNKYAGNVHSFRFESADYPDIYAGKSLNGEGELAVNAGMWNPASENVQAAVIAAVYSKSTGKLIGSSYETIDIPSGKWVAVPELTLDVSNAAGDYEVKVFAWNAGNFAPLVAERILQ